jgi:hypothetical protein
MTDTLTDLRSQAVRRLEAANKVVMERATSDGLCNLEWPPMIESIRVQQGAIRHLIEVNNIIADYKRAKDEGK